jgi:Fe-S cluster biogenesis protein NfuA
MESSMILPDVVTARGILAATGATMIPRERVQAVIERIRPLIQGDGGDIELVDVVDNKAKVRLTGNCVGCPSAQMTLFMGVEMALKEEIPEFEELIVV